MALGATISAMARDGIEDHVAPITDWYRSKLLPVRRNRVWLAFRAGRRVCDIDILVGRRTSSQYVIHLTRFLTRFSIGRMRDLHLTRPS
jgi:hypothetical protein